MTLLLLYTKPLDILGKFLNWVLNSANCESDVEWAFRILAGNTFACQFLSGGVGLRKFQNATSINYLEKREKQISKIPILLRDANFVSIDRDEIEVKFWASRKVPLNEEQLTVWFWTTFMLTFFCEICLRRFPDMLKGILIGS